MEFPELSEKIRDNIAHAIIGKSDVIELMMVCLLVQGHVLLEDVPGVGKTTLAKALARSLDCTFARIQFTPDLLPSDVTGINFFNQKTQTFEFRSGPIMNQVILADEINRATPRTQSSLLEVMQERQVTIDGKTYNLQRPFIVMATQNPIELEGTFPLPEAQIDRFLMRVKLGYPTLSEEEEVLLRYQYQDPLENIKPVVSTEDVILMQDQVKDVHVSVDIRQYILKIARSTRDHPSVALGVSPRGTLALYKASQALAAIRGRTYVIPSDVQTLCNPIMTHRVHISPQIRLRGRTPAEVIAEIIDTVPVPVVE